jgi:biotin carboxyl carrier protein
VAIEVYQSEEAVERAAFLASARGGRPRAGHVIGRSVELGYQGRTYAFTVGEVGPQRYSVEVEGRVVEASLDRLSEHESRLGLGGRWYHVSGVAGRGSHLVEVDGFTHRVVRDEAGVVRAPAPAVVVAIRVGPGDTVEAGATVAVLESMKMETAVRAPQAGVVREVLAAVNSQVDAGAPLMRLDAVDGAAAPSDAPTVEFPDAQEAVGDPRAHALALLHGLRGLVMGYDVSLRRGQELVAQYLRTRAELDADDAELLRGELLLMTTFADLCELSRNRPADDEESADEQVHSPREHFHTYLHSLDVARENLPASFTARLSRALRHHGVTDLDPSPQLEEAVYRIFLAQQRAADHIPVVTAVLERWLGQEEVGAGARDEVGDVVERLVVATQLRYPAVGDLARSIRYRMFEEPQIQQARERAHAEIREHLAHLDANPDAPDRAERITAMVNGTEPIVALLGTRLAGTTRCAPWRTSRSSSPTTGRSSPGRSS